MSTEAERLRRSKRNKFFLDVTALNSANPERRKSQPVAATSPEPAPNASSPGPSGDKQSNSPAPPEEESKRPRRPTRINSFVYADESEEEDDSKTVVGMFGSNCCTKCPSRFETRPGLANHFRLHGNEKRKFSCDICDFSCGSAKAMRNHRRCHSVGRPYKEESPTHTHSDTRSDTSESHTPPQLTPVRSVPTAPTPTFGGPPQLDAVSPPTAAASGDKSATRKRNRCPECPFAVRNRRRFEAHLISHRRTTGFQCHSCTLTTLSSGFLKRHIVEVHKEKDFPWPPKFVNDVNEKQPVALDVEPPRPSTEKLERRKKHRGKLLMRAVTPKEDVLMCPVEGCSHECYSHKQMVFHKRRSHTDKNRPMFRCCSACGLRLKTAGALKVHKIIRHPTKKMHPKAKKLLIVESVPRFFLRHLLLDMAAKGASLPHVSAPSPVLDSAPPTPVTACPPALTASQSAPSLVNLNGESLTVPSSLLGMDLPDCLKGIDFEKAELLAELQKSAEHEFCCDECPFTTAARAKLDRHISRHQIKSDAQCPLCSFACRGDDMLKQHARLHMAVIYKRRQEAEKLVGDLPMIFAGPSSSQTPKPSTPPVPPPTPSSTSGKVTMTPGTARLNNQLPLRPTPQTTRGGKRKAFPNTSFVTKGGTRMRRCLECPYITRHSCDLLSHYNMHTSKPQRYKCTQCSYSTKRAVCLRSHYQSHREQNAEKSTKRHFRLRVNGAYIGFRSGAGQCRIYSCSRCPFVSRTLVSLWHHVRFHLFTKGALFKCSVCPFFGISVEVLEEHLLLHGENATTEHMCGTPVPSTGTKRQLSEPKAIQERPAKIRKVHSARATPSPAPVLIKEEPMEEIKMETDDSCDSKYESATTSSRSSVVPALDAPLSIAVEQFMQPEPELLILLRKEHVAEEMGRCPDCPFVSDDFLMMRLHRDLHRGPPRPMKCDLCTFSCMTPEALHYHISLHLPALSPNSAAIERRKAAQRRRAQASELIPHGVPHFACTKCNFRTMTKDSYQEHMFWHAQELQRRLLTTIKRNTQNDDHKMAKIIRRTPKKADKFFCCHVCSFRCETEPAFYRHLEGHGLNGWHKCSICSYSSNTLSITQFHEMNHHSDHTLCDLNKMAVLAPHAIALPVERTDEKIQKLADNVYRCKRCPEFVCYEVLEMRRHYESLHNETPDDKEVVESLALGMLPLNSIVTLA